MHYLKKIIIPLFVVLAFGGCSKYLEKKTDQRLVIPASLRDYQAMLDSYSSIRRETGDGELAADSYYLEDATWESVTTEVFKRTYTWEKDNSTFTGGWIFPYQSVFIANTVLEGLKKIERTEINKEEYDFILGQAHFLRGRCHFTVANNWSLAYDSNTAETDLGVVLRTSSDFNIQKPRSSMKETFEHIISDLEKSIPLLITNPKTSHYGSKPAALGLLARVYLFKREYSKCFEYADACLKLKNTLLDFNNLNSADQFPVPFPNPEIIYTAQNSGSTLNTMDRARMDSNLYRSFQPGDLRKEIFFRLNPNGTYAFKGSYLQGQNGFAGVAVDEVLLMRAECYAREGNTLKAMEDLNRLMRNRWDKNTFSEWEAVDANDALRLILEERRKELIFRCIRWPDIKRLNKEGANISLYRFLKGKLYTLPPNDLRFALCIPEAAIEREPLIIPNPRD